MNTSLLIDGHFFVYSRLHVMPKMNLTYGDTGNSKILGTEDEYKIFIRKLATDFAYEVNKVKGIINRIIFVYDSRSWRKDFFPNSGYKANRVYDDTIDWKNVHKAFKEFQDILEDKGIIVESVDGAEGDDLIYAWSVYLNSIGENCIIWSGDKDLMQLVNYNSSTASYTIWYDNTYDRIGLYPGFENWLNTKEQNNDIFNLTSHDDYIKNELKEFIRPLRLETIYCDEFIFLKILNGDKSDNIKSVVEIEKTIKNGETRINKISETKGRNILKYFKRRHRRMSSTFLFEDSYKNDIVNLIKAEMKVKTPKSEIKERFELNINLMLLHTKTIPDAIHKSMFDLIKNDISIKFNEFDKISSMKTILKDTTYIK